MRPTASAQEGRTVDRKATAQPVTPSQAVRITGIDIPMWDVFCLVLKVCVCLLPLVLVGTFIAAALR